MKIFKLFFIFFCLILLTGCSPKIKQDNFIKNGEYVQEYATKYCKDHGTTYLNHYSHDAINWRFICYYESPLTFKEYDFK